MHKFYIVFLFLILSSCSVCDFFRIAEEIIIEDIKEINEISHSHPYREHHESFEEDF